MGPRSTVGGRPEWMQGRGVDLLWEMGGGQETGHMWLSLHILS